MLEPSRNRANGGWWKRKTGLEKKLIIGGAVITVIAVLFAVLYFLKKPCAKEEECTSKFCVKAASELLDFVNFKEDPCQHFYRFVCGSYYKHAVKRNTVSPFVTIQAEFENEMKSIIVDPVKKKDSNGNVMMKKFYHECMNETKIDKDGNKAFIRAINKLGGWPLLNGSNWNPQSFDWVDWHVRARQLGLPIYEFFVFERVDSTDNDTLLQISSPNPETVVGRYTYNDVMKEIIETLGVKDFRERENEDVFDFMVKLKKYQKKQATRNDLKGILKHLLSFTSNDDGAVGSIEDLNAACPMIPWLRMLNSMAENEIKFDTSSQVAFGGIKEYCKELDNFLKSTNPRTIANYLVWSIIHHTHHFLSRDIRNAYESIKDTNAERYKICHDEADRRFRFVKESVYIRRRTPKEVKEQLIEMIDIMKDVFIEHLKVCEWMDETTKKNAIERAGKITNVIGGEDVLYDVDAYEKIIGVDGFTFTSDNMFEMERQKRIKENHHFFKTLYGLQGEDWASFFKNAVQLNAFFIQPLNVMILPAPILSSIFYDYRKPAFMNYGSIGRVIGHEIMHGFEKSGRLAANLETEEMEDWWTNATAAAYDKKVQCTIDEYERIPFRYKLNGTLTLDENLSDFVGIDVAYESYLRYVKKHGAEKKLPGIPLTPEQIYWVQTGTFLCFRKLDDDDTDYEEEDEHAIPAFRVQGGARHSRYFAKDFNCPVGSNMNPKDKCRIL